MNKVRKIITVLGIASLTACATADHMSQGMIYANQQDFANAVTEFKAQIAKDPTTEAYANLGAAYMRQGKNNLAMDSFKRGERLNGDNTTLTYNMTGLFSIMDKTDIALQYLDKTLANGFANYDAIRHDPDLANLRGEPEFRTTLEKYKIFLQ